MSHVIDRCVMSHIGMRSVDWPVLQSKILGWHDAFVCDICMCACATWPKHVRDVTHSYARVWRDSFVCTCVTWLIRMHYERDMTQTRTVESPASQTKTSTWHKLEWVASRSAWVMSHILKSHVTNLHDVGGCCGWCGVALLQYCSV